MRTSSVDKHTSEGEMPVRLCNYVDVYRNDKVGPNPDSMVATATTEEVERFRLLVGDTILTKDSEDPSDIGISAYVETTDRDFVCGYHLAIARPTWTVHPRYLTWALRGTPALHHLSAHAAGISRYGLAISDLRGTPIPWCEIEEQRRIADFLDDRVARIDRIIAARREQQRLAREAHSTSLQGVFDALVERFGEGRLGFALARMEQGWSPQAEAVPAELGEWGVMRAGCVNGGVFNAVDNKRLPNGLEPVRSYEIQGGDLLMSRASGSLDLIGSVAVVPDDVRDGLLLCDKIYRLIPLPGWHAEFLAPMLRVRRNRELIRLGTSGAEGMANNLPSGVVRELRVPIAPGRQQLQVSGEAAAEGAQVEGVVGSLARSIDLLTEYKQSLITAAVTGELDVTTAGSGMPG